MQIFKKILLLMCITTITLPQMTVSADTDEKKVIRVAIADDAFSHADRLVYTALTRLGYEVVLESSGMLSSIVSVNEGYADVLGSQAATIMDSYKNLVLVPESISSTKFVTYVKDNFSKPVKSWSDLKGMTIAFSAQATHVALHMPAKVHEVRCSSHEEAIKAVLNGDAEIAVAPVVEGGKLLIPEGIREYSIIDNVPVYSFVHKDCAWLAPLLAKEYLAMRQDGTMDKIKTNTLPRKTAEKTVLHISSYSTDMVWERDLVRGVSDAVTKYDSNILYYNFSLNLKRIYNIESQFKLMCGQISSTFLERDPDIVIVSDNDAMNFIKSQYNRFFSNTPVVFCGVNDYSPSELSPFEGNATGVTEDISVQDTVNLILSLYPNTKNLYVVNDYTTAGCSWQKAMERDLNKYTNRVNVVYNPNSTVNDILEDIRKLGSDTIVLCGSFYRDSSGEYYSESKIAQYLNSANKYPVFGLMSINIGHGILGGKVIDPYKQGYTAGEIAGRILNGEKPSNISVLTDPQNLNPWMFDHNIAKEYDMKISKLPEDHIAINRKMTFAESNPVGLAVIIVIFAFTMVIIITLLLFARKENRIKKEQEYIARHDPLTGLSNRIMFESELANMISKNSIGGAMLLDLDDFKEINDVYGHVVGDSFLVAFAERLSEINLGSGFISRVGGDEFYIITFRNREMLAKTADKIIKLLEQPFIVNNTPLYVTASIGISTFPDDGNNVVSIMQCADLALYEAKKMGKNQYCFFSKIMSERALREEKVLQVLRSSIKNNEALLMYQPIVRASDMSVLAFEALFRIQNPDLGLLSPDEVIPIAEHNGLIVSLGKWIMEQACIFAKDMLEKNLVFSHISINISAIQLSHHDFVDSVKQTLIKTGLNPRHLQLEITESSLVDETNQNLQVLKELKELGITIAVDDFGTGYSSLGYLVELPIDTLKIDKSFIADIVDDEKRRAVTVFTIDIAHALGLSIVAEGVETHSQCKLLMNMGCDTLQGFLFSEPISAGKAEQLLKDGYKDCF